ncbi:DMT family transporter [Peptostreptococcaceae bacterium AGR-M142]
MFGILGLINGFIIAVMVFCNGYLGNFLKGFQSILIINMVGILFSSLILIIKEKKLNIKKIDKSIPIYYYFGGVAGFLVVYSNIICLKHITVSALIALVLIGQIIASSLIDHFGIFGVKKYLFKKEKFIGIFMIFIGIYIMNF